MGPKCPLCSNQSNLSRLEKWGEYEILRCGECRLDFSWPMLAGTKEWYDNAYLMRRVVPMPKVRNYFRLGLHSLPKGSKILDIGCGEGDFIEYAANRGCQVWGMDFSAEMIAMAKKRAPQSKFFAGTLEEFLQEHPGGKFDGATMFEVIEHLSDPLSTLSEVKKLLKPGGRVIVSVPNQEAWPVSHFVDHPPHHLTWWNKEALILLAQKAGFEAESVKTTSYLVSLHFLATYLTTQLPLYVLLGQKQKFLGSRATAAGDADLGKLTSSFLHNFGPWLRKIRNAIYWPGVLLLSPFLWPVVKGTSLVLSAKFSASKSGSS